MVRRLILFDVGGGTGVQNEGYLYDLMGNVTQRQNNASSLTENFYYDNLYRLDYSTLKVGAGAATTNLDLAYDLTGNITTKSDVGAYDYSTPQSGCTNYANNQKHAVRNAGGTVYCYDANGNMVRRGVSTNTISWTSYNYPSTINSGTETVSFLYGPERQRWRTQLTSGGVTETTYHVGREFQKVQTASTDYRHYIYVGSRSVAIYSRLSTGTNTLRYVLEDHQGSATNLLTSTGTSIVKENFSAFGNRRNPATWSGAPIAADLTAINAITREGYTWQTALGAMGLNHMNGRVEDSISGRFISPDPNIPDPMNTGDYNRYAYVNSNPMTFTDPTGFEELEEVVVTGSRPSFEGDFSFMDSGGWGWNGFDFGARDMPLDSLDTLDEVVVVAVAAEPDPPKPAEPPAQCRQYSGSNFVLTSAGAIGMVGGAYGAYAVMSAGLAMVAAEGIGGGAGALIAVDAFSYGIIWVLYWWAMGCSCRGHARIGGLRHLRLD
jgi:RHS repeat-associated protein